MHMRRKSCDYAGLTLCACKILYISNMPHKVVTSVFQPVYMKEMGYYQEVKWMNLVEK